MKGSCVPVLTSRMLRMLLTSLLDRFPLMAKMALKWPLLARKASCQSSLVTNTPAHPSFQLPRHLAQATGPRSQAPAHEGDSLDPLPAVLQDPGHLSFPGVHRTPAHLRPLHWLFLLKYSSPHSGGERLLTLRVSAKMSPPPRFPISKVSTSCHSQPCLNHPYSS